MKSHSAFKDEDVELSPHKTAADQRDAVSISARRLRKSSLTLNFNQANKNRTRSKTIHENIDDEFTCPGSPDQPGGFLPEADNFPVVLTSPDIEMVKLSTPDLDNYLIRLQRELSAGGSICDDLEPKLLDPAIPGLETPSASYSSTTQNETELNATYFREILNLAEKDSEGARFNSFDSGFSEVFVKTEIESELEENVLDNYRLNWREFDKLKSENSFHDFAKGSASDGMQQTSESYDKIKCWSFSNECFETEKECGPIKLPLNSNKDHGHHHHQDHHNRSYPSFCVNSFNRQIFDRRGNVGENKEQGNQSRLSETCERFIEYATRKEFFKDEPRLKFSWSSPDPDLGGMCSEHSSPLKEDVKRISARVHFPSNSFSVNSESLDHFKAASEHHGDVSRNLSSDEHLPTVEAKRELFRRQDAYSTSDAFINDRFEDFHLSTQYNSQFLSQSIKCTNINNNNNAEREDSCQFGCVTQEFMKLQRKRARNRLAATRCRNRKLERINLLRREVESLKDLNSKYVDRVRRLQHEVDLLQNHVTFHVTMGCDLSCLFEALR